MIRGFHLADFFTLANAACGVGAVFCAIRYAAIGASSIRRSAASSTRSPT
jgi:CDP-diacylglycerol--serine O-phosphatidyltransferase